MRPMRELVFNLAPPILSKRDPATGELRKREFGQWGIPAFLLLAKLRFLRGTAFDVFGRTQERRAERALIAQYKSNVDQTLSVIASTRDAGHYEAAVKLAELPESIRGYGHVQERSIEAPPSGRRAFRNRSSAG
jgi:indolepyruvate ferredoxin oxidoreductase